MNRKMKMIQDYIGVNVEQLLNDEPFRSYNFTISVERDLNEYSCAYICEEYGLEFHCDEDKRIRTIFLSRESDLSDRLDVRIGWSSHEVRHRLGVPTKSGKSWDRFDGTKYAFHVSYDQYDLVEMITLMRDDVVPR